MYVYTYVCVCVIIYVMIYNRDNRGHGDNGDLP